MFIIKYPQLPPPLLFPPVSPKTQDGTWSIYISNQSGTSRKTLHSPRSATKAHITLSSTHHNENVHNTLRNLHGHTHLDRLFVVFARFDGAGFADFFLQHCFDGDALHTTRQTRAETKGTTRCISGNVTRKCMARLAMPRKKSIRIPRKEMTKLQLAATTYHRSTPAHGTKAVLALFVSRRMWPNP